MKGRKKEEEMNLRPLGRHLRWILAGLLLGGCLARPQPDRPAILPLPEGQAGRTAAATAPPAIQPVLPGTNGEKFRAKDPATFTWTASSGPRTLDPALAYDLGSGMVIQNVYETLIFYDRQDPARFIPQLAEAVPSRENDGLSADGREYRFKIRPGVRFHNGNELTPSDVAYSFQRGLLQGGTDTPQWLLAEPIFGFGVDDIAVLVEAAGRFGPEALRQPLSAQQQAQMTGELYNNQEKLGAVDPAVLRAVCERVKVAIVADEQAGTVTFHLVQPWGPFLGTLAGYWGSVIDQEWVAEVGGWDGSCTTWQNFYVLPADQNPLNALMNGTGPFRLDSWTPDEVVLVRHEDYWRSEPIWPGGPAGPAGFERVRIKLIEGLGNRLAMLEAGDLDAAPASESAAQMEYLVGETCEFSQAAGDFKSCRPSASPGLSLRAYTGFPLVTRSDVFFNFGIHTEGEGENFLIGSGRLDGEGIPPDFFADMHVRKAFNYCFDRETYIQDALNGEAIQTIGIPLPGMAGFDPNGPRYTFDLSKCESEFRASAHRSPEGKTLWETGFRLQLAYNPENYLNRTVVEILTESLAAVNEKFRVKVIDLAWPIYLRYREAGYLPLFLGGWQEDIHDPHNWYKPYLDGPFSSWQALPEALRARFQELINRGVLENDPDRRHAIYQQLNQQVYETAPGILLAIPTGRFYVQRWVQGWYHNPLYPGLYFYALSKQ